MNTLTLKSTIASKVDNMTLGGSVSTYTNTSSSNAIATTFTVNNATWTTMSITPLNDVLAVWVQNDNTTYSASVITVATGSAAVTPLSILTPGYASLICWSGSMGPALYAKVTSGLGTTGSLQFVAAQS